MSSVFTDVYDAAQPGKFDSSDERDCLTRYFRHTGFFSSLQALVTNRMPVWFRAHLLSLSRWTLSSAVEMSFAPFLPMLLRLKSSSESCKSRKLPITSLQRSKSTTHNNTKKAAILRKFSTFYTNKKYLQLILFYKISLNPSCHHNKPLVTSVCAKKDVENATSPQNRFFSPQLQRNARERCAGTVTWLARNEF